MKVAVGVDHVGMSFCEIMVKTIEATGADVVVLDQAITLEEERRSSLW